MALRGYWVGDKPESAGLLMKVEISRIEGDGGHPVYGWGALNPTFRKSVPWLKGKQRGVIFVLREAGRASAHDEDVMAPRITKALAHPDEATQDAVGIALARGWWDSDDRIYIPEPIISRVIGNWGSSASAWFWARNGRFEIWSDEQCASRTASSNKLLLRLLSDPSPDEATS